MIKVMVFGTFDGLHAGHRSFLSQARKYGDYLIAVVASDAVVKKFKQHAPTHSLKERITHLEKEDGVDEAVPSDMVMGSWDVIKKYRPDVIAYGYDQHALKKNLESNIAIFGYAPKIIMMEPFEPEKYHSSILKK